MERDDCQAEAVEAVPCQSSQPATRECKFSSMQGDVASKQLKKVCRFQNVSAERTGRKPCGKRCVFSGSVLRLNSESCWSGSAIACSGKSTDTALLEGDGNSLQFFLGIAREQPSNGSLCT